MNARAPIGVFDSGVGGLSVLRELRRAFANEELLYVADSAFVPYGEKTPRQVEARALAISEFLLSQQAKAIVVACNTATGAAIATLRARFPVPIVGIEPAIKPAVGQTASGVVAVLATGVTLAGEKFTNLLNRFSGEALILAQPCDGLVDRVEAGDLQGAETRALIERYLRPLIARGADTVILGCTHYPFLAPLIREVAGPGVSIVDPNAAIAQELRRRLEHGGLLSDAPSRGGERFWTSGRAGDVQRVFTQLWGDDAPVRRLPERYCAPPQTGSP